MEFTSRRLQNLKASPIRDILAVIERPGMISYAGGLPAPESFPTLPAEPVPARFLQYGPTEGEPELRAAIADEVRHRGLPCTAEQVIVTTGSQQGLDLAAKLCIDEGTEMAVEYPTYLAALQVFRFFGARFTPLQPGGLAPRVRVAYACPTFQNPTGKCYTAAERAALAEACDRNAAFLIEDDPYHDLVYDPCDRTPICALRERGSWMYQGSFSKAFAPGLRLGYVVVSRDLIGPMTWLKQAADLHSNRPAQFVALRLLEDPGYRTRLAALAQAYKAKRDGFAEQLQSHLGNHASWTPPRGGLFFWLELDEALQIDTRALLQLAIERNVAFMPGEPFWPGSPPGPSLRLNFSFASLADNNRGLGTLAELLAAHTAPEQARDSRPSVGSAA